MREEKGRRMTQPRYKNGRRIVVKRGEYRAVQLEGQTHCRIYRYSPIGTWDELVGVAHDVEAGRRMIEEISISQRWGHA
jgi:hypothetical protein